MNYCRELNSDSQIEKFVDNILEIPYVDKRMAINRIANAERNIRGYDENQTLMVRDYRDFEYRDDTRRSSLRQKIINELFILTRLSDDEKITLGKGGAKPVTGTQCESTAYFIIGLPASGKSSIAEKVADNCGCYILDSDYAKRKLPEYSNQIGGATLVHTESNHIIFGDHGLMDRCLQSKANLVIPKIGHNIDSVINFANGFKNAGYKVYLISVDLDRKKATQRAYKRFTSTNRYVPLSLIFDGYGNDPTLNYFRIKQNNKYRSIFDGYCQLSTDVPEGKPIKLLETINIDISSYVEVE